jgi:hypothetical protein
VDAVLETVLETMVASDWKSRGQRGKGGMMRKHLKPWARFTAFTAAAVFTASLVGDPPALAGHLGVFLSGFLLYLGCHFGWD